jgi:hypothetical protein
VKWVRTTCCIVICALLLTITASTAGTMVHLKHSAIHWRVRCVLDSSSEDENTPPNVATGSAASRVGNSHGGNVTKTYDDDASTGTATPPGFHPVLRS